jgi:hypothetical protein
MDGCMYACMMMRSGKVAGRERAKKKKKKKKKRKKKKERKRKKKIGDGTMVDSQSVPE